MRPTAWLATALTALLLAAGCTVNQPTDPPFCNGVVDRQLVQDALSDTPIPEADVEASDFECHVGGGDEFSFLDLDLQSPLSTARLAG